MAPENVVDSATFPQFFRFPTEIRYKIRLLTLKPQVVEIKYYSPQDTTQANYNWWRDTAELTDVYSTYSEGSTPGVDGYLPSWDLAYFSTAPLPVAFHICNDSR
jgi:hypothetical protein